MASEFTALSSSRKDEKPSQASSTHELDTFQRSEEGNEGKEEVVLAVGIEEVTPKHDELNLVPVSPLASKVFQPISSDPDWYLECFDEFLGRSDSHDVIASWIKYNVRSMVQNQLDVRRGLLSSPTVNSQENVYNILSLGSGSGELDTAIIKMLRSVRLDSRISVTAVEPDVTMLERFRDLVSSEPKMVDVDFHFNQQTSSEFIQITEGNAETDMTFDMIHSIHMMYYVPLVELEATLKYCYQRLCWGGYFVIFITSEFYNLVINKYLPKWHIDYKPCVCSEAIQTSLDNLGISYDVETDHKEVVDVTPVFDSAPSAAGDRLLDFFMNCITFREIASEDTLAEGMDLLRNICHEREDGRMMANVKCDVLIIKRPSKGL